MSREKSPHQPTSMVRPPTIRRIFARDLWVRGRAPGLGVLWALVGILALFFTDALDQPRMIVLVILAIDVAVKSRIGRF